MTNSIIHDRGRGPELVGTRITVYNLLPHLVDPTATESYICKLYDLSPDQVAAARAFVLNNFEAVSAKNSEIEARIAAGNSPEIHDRSQRVRLRFEEYQRWVAERTAAATAATSEPLFPTFDEWLSAK